MAQIFIFLSFFACRVPTSEEIDKQISDDMVKDVQIFSPRENVECYVLPAKSASRPRIMSCVTLPHPVKP